MGAGPIGLHRHRRRPPARCRTATITGSHPAGRGARHGCGRRRRADGRRRRSSRSTPAAWAWTPCLTRRACARSSRPRPTWWRAGVVALRSWACPRTTASPTRCSRSWTRSCPSTASSCYANTYPAAVALVPPPAPWRAAGHHPPLPARRSPGRLRHCAQREGPGHQGDGHALLPTPQGVPGADVAGPAVRSERPRRRRP